MPPTKVIFMTGNNNSPWDPNNQQGHGPGYGQNQQGLSPGYGQNQPSDYQYAHYPQDAPGYGGQPPAGYEPYPYGQPKRSNKMPIIIAVVVVALIAIGALVFFLLNGDDDNPDADPARFRSGMEDILAETGLTQETAEAQGITPEQWDTYLSCVTDESMHRLTPEAIETISGGEDVYDSHSVDELSDIGMQCGDEAGIF